MESSRSLSNPPARSCDQGPAGAASNAKPTACGEEGVGTTPEEPHTTGQRRIHPYLRSKSENLYAERHPIFNKETTEIQQVELLFQMLDVDKNFMLSPDEMLFFTPLISKTDSWGQLLKMSRVIMDDIWKKHLKSNVSVSEISLTYFKRYLLDEPEARIRVVWSNSERKSVLGDFHDDGTGKPVDVSRGKAAVDAGPGFINDDNGATSTTFFEQSHSSCAAEEGIRSSPSLRKSDNEGTTQESGDRSGHLLELESIHSI
eukprot:jgi/Bigna1/68416/fgenesh1_pg.6_\